MAWVKAPASETIVPDSSVRVTLRRARKACASGRVDNMTLFRIGKERSPEVIA